jgi:tetratricopeptide (TPR) repeat protein
MVFTKVDTEKMYDNMMNKYSYGNLKQEGLYLDETTMRMCYTHRRWFSMLISALIDEGKTEMAMKALEKVSTEIPAYNVPHDSGSGSIDLAQAYIRCGQLDKAEEILNALKDKSKEYAYWYIGLSSTRFVASMRECRQDISILSIISDMFGDMAKVQEDKAEHYNSLAAECMQHAESLSQAFFSKAQSAGVDF